MRPEERPGGGGGPRLLLAGEHTQPLYWSFLHGARLAGIQQADKIIQYKQQA